MKCVKLILVCMFCLFALGSSAQELAYNHKNLPCLNKHYNVFVHVSIDSFGNTNMPVEVINQAFAEANEAFAPICVSFSMCKLDTTYNQKLNLMNDEVEVIEVKNLYGHDNRINLYLMGDHYNFGLCGLATQSAVNHPTQSDIYVIKPCGGQTLIHEFGHLFGLRHTYGTREELVNGDNCFEAEDQICDTPADPYVLGDSITWYINPECEFIYTKEKDENGDWYQPDVGNYMSFYPCKCGFTREQYLKMVETYHNTELKNW